MPGICLTLLVLGVFVRFNATPIVMASGRELCYFLLAGILAAYLVTFALMAAPTTATCAIIRLQLGVSLACIYAAILTKTSRLARVFTSQITSAQRPSCITPASQLAICSALVGVQFAGAVVWLVVE